MVAAYNEGMSVSNGSDPSRSAKRSIQLCTMLQGLTALKQLQQGVLKHMSFFTEIELHMATLATALWTQPAADLSPNALLAHLKACLRGRGGNISSMQVFQEQLSFIQVAPLTMTSGSSLRMSTASA